MTQMKISDVQDWVGAPVVPTVQYQAAHGDLIETAWRDRLTGEDGWWWALSRGPKILALQWAPGGEVERDEDIRRALVATLRAGSVAA